MIVKDEVKKITGLILPMDVNRQGTVVEIGIEEADFTRFIILTKGKGHELFDCLYANVTVTGKISGKDSDGNPTILVEEYKVNQRFQMNNEFES